MYDPYFDPSQSVCPVKTANIQVWFTAGTLTPNNCIAPWGIIVPHTSSVTAYSVTSGTTCPSQSRVCTNGSLSGTYMNQTCTVTAPTPTPVGDVGACFVAGTQVLMANGTYKKIETVGSSDFLMSSQGPERVMKRYHIPYKGLVYAFNGDGHYFVTPTHPFMTTEGWKSLDPAGTRRESPGIKVTKLEIGDSLVLLGNTTKVLTQLDSKEISTTVYNFGVNGTHDFYADNYLVHNVDMYFIERVHAGTNLTK
jgi:hypothetical protein